MLTHLLFAVVIVTSWACGGANAPVDASSPKTEAAAPKQHKTWPVALSVVARVPVQGGESQVREGLADALDDASFDGLGSQHFLLSASLSELDRNTSGSAATISCSIDLAVTESNSGRLVGTVKGHARVEASTHDDEAENDVLHAAAKEAIGSALSVAKSAH